jgi:hypothetical protein
VAAPSREGRLQRFTLQWSLPSPGNGIVARQTRRLEVVGLTLGNVRFGSITDVFTDLLRLFRAARTLFCSSTDSYNAAVRRFLSVTS